MLTRPMAAPRMAWTAPTHTSEEDDDDDDGDVEIDALLGRMQQLREPATGSQQREAPREQPTAGSAADPGPPEAAASWEHFATHLQILPMTVSEREARERAWLRSYELQ